MTVGTVVGNFDPLISAVVSKVVDSAGMSEGNGLPIAPVFINEVPVKSLVGIAENSSKLENKV